MALSARLKEIRKDLNKTQQEMAEELGVGFRTYQRYEEGKRIPGGYFFVHVAIKGFNVHWVITGDGDKMAWDSLATEPFLREIWNWLNKTTSLVF